MQSAKVFVCLLFACFVSADSGKKTNFILMPYPIFENGIR
jgi:hypothetical protein